MCWDDENESVVTAQKEDVKAESPVASSVLNGKALSNEEQIKLETLLSFSTAIPMGFGPEDVEFSDRLIRMAENLEKFKEDNSSFKFNEEPRQAEFEYRVSQSAMEFGMTKLLDLALALRTFAEHLRIYRSIVAA